jgi:S1-C subfamily serine protease
LKPSNKVVDDSDFKPGYFSSHRRSLQQGAGSGFLWDSYGCAVTNFHIIQGAQSIQVRL